MELSQGKISDTHYHLYPNYLNLDLNYLNLRYPILNLDNSDHPKLV